MVLSSFRDPGQGKWLDNQSGRAEATSGWVTIDKRECVIGKQIQTSLLYRMFPHGRQGGHNGVPKNETAAMLELQYNPVAVELWFWYANFFLFSNKFVKMLATWVKTPYSILVSHTFELFSEDAQIPGLEHFITQRIHSESRDMMVKAWSERM